MIVGQPVAEVSSSLVGCTFKHQCYKATIDGIHFNIYDTAGLNEGEQGRVPHWKAIHELYTLIRSLDGVSLLIYCMRGRIKENARANWILFHKVLCATKVPIIAVETGLEREEDLEGRGPMLRGALEKYGMVPLNVACISSVQSSNEKEQNQYNSSQIRLRKLIRESYEREAWSMTTDDWIGHIYKTTYTTKLCLFPDVRVEFASEVGNLVDNFIEETGMEAAESKKLKSTLLDAERRLRKRFLNFL